MGDVTQSKRQLAWVFDLNKCIGCQTCSVACKVLWHQDAEGVENQRAARGRHGDAARVVLEPGLQAQGVAERTHRLRYTREILQDESDLTVGVGTGLALGVGRLRDRGPGPLRSAPATQLVFSARSPDRARQRGDLRGHGLGGPAPRGAPGPDGVPVPSGTR